MSNYRHFSLAAYFVAHAAARVTREELEKQLAFMERYIRLDKVYLEPWRGELVPREQIALCREVLEAHGIQVAGGLTTVIPTPEGDAPKQRLFGTFCYNDEKMRQKLREVSAYTASLFDEFLIDDFFFTNCTCAACIQARDEFNRAHGIKSGWQSYRLDLMRRVSEEDVIAPAKAANPNCRVIIKYPNWAESYQETGYNPAEQRGLFDGLYTGTETRDPVTTDQHLPRYLSFSLMTYFENMWPGHNGGGWFDNFDTHITEHYLEQAYLTAFSRPKELMLFCFQSLYDHMYVPALGFQLDKLDSLLDYAGKPAGIACFLPDNAQGEDNVQDYLGMAGLPVVCTPYFPQDASQILLTASSAYDPDILEKLRAYLASGKKTALVTTGFWEAVKDRGYEDLTSVRPGSRRVTARRYRVEERQNVCVFPEGARPVTLPAPEFRNNSTWALVKASFGEESSAILLRDAYMDSALFTLSVPDARPDIYHLPAPVLSAVRRHLPVNGAWLEGPARISLFVYDNDTVILYPYVMEEVQRGRVMLHVRGARALCSRPAGRTVQPLYVRDGEAVFDQPAEPGRYTLYQIIR